MFDTASVLVMIIVGGPSPPWRQGGGGTRTRVVPTTPTGKVSPFVVVVLNLDELLRRLLLLELFLYPPATVFVRGKAAAVLTITSSTRVVARGHGGFFHHGSQTNDSSLPAQTPPGGTDSGAVIDFIVSFQERKECRRIVVLVLPVEHHGLVLVVLAVLATWG
jgi:hypothetical protein